MWTNKYIGIPYKDAGDDENGLDCWGLVRLVYKNEFNIELPSFKQTRLDAYDIRSAIIDEYKQDGWTEIAEPSPGAVVLVRVQGLPIHTGVMVDKTKFLNILPGANCVIADITDSRWRNRIIGFYKYTPNSHSILLTGAPHPLKTQIYTMPAMAGHTLAEISNIIASTYKVPPNIVDRTIMIVNGRPIPQENWSTFKLFRGDRVEYRTRAGVESLIAELIYYFTYGELFAASAAAGEIYVAATAAEALAAAGVISSTGLAIASAAATVLISTAISYALAPPRPKLNTNDPGSAEAQLLATGNANQLSRYGTIPIVLGKMKIVPPLGAINYISYYGADERDSYLSMLLTWGYGPLKLYNWKPNSVLKEPTGSSNPSYYKWDATSTGTQYSGLKLGNIILDNYTIDAITHKNIYDGDYIAGATNASKESESGFNSIYGQDHNQQFKNQVIANDIHPLNGTGTVANPTLSAVEATVPNLGSSVTNTSEFYNKIEIALHFPEGLRKIRVKGDNENAGKSYSLSGPDNPTTGTTTTRQGLLATIQAALVGDGSKIPLVLKFEYKLGAVTTPASSATTYLPLKVKDKFGNTTDNNGILVLGDISYKDAFTRVYYADNTITQPSGTSIFPFKGEITVRVTRLTGGRGEAPAEGTTEYQTFGIGDIPEACYLYREQDEDVIDTNGYVINRNRTTGYIPAPSYTTETACLAANSSANLANNEYYQWTRDTTNADDGSVSLAQNWRLLHTVNFLSFTASRNAKVLVSPKSKTSSSTEDILLSHTALRINSSEQLNGQLEGINGVVQTLGREYTGTDPTVVDLTKWVDLTPINNPASLFLHVLTSPANPKRILWSEISTKVDLVKIQKWWKYCDNRPSYTFAPDNRIVGGKFTYNQAIGQAKSVLDILKDIASAGRASPAQVDGRWTVHIDEEKPNIVQMFSPHNSWDFSSTRNLDKAPDGLRISFYDEDNDYQESEIIVYNKDKTEANSVLFESISLPGITKASLAEDHAKWHMAQAIVRRELYTLNTDLEYLICNRGDRVTVTHDVPMWGYGSGRILRRGTFNSSFHTLIVDLDEPVILDPSKSYGIKIRSSSFSSQSVERGIVTSNIAFQSISRASDGFTVTVVIGNQYAPVTIGDKIVINSTGDFSTTNNSPAIVTSVNDTVSPLSFTYIKAGTANATSGAGTINLTNGLYRRIKFDSIVGTYTGTKKDGTTNVTVNLAEEGDLFLFGEYQKVSNDLLVLGIEPDTNKGARLTLVDYAYKGLFEPLALPTGITGIGGVTTIPAYLSQTADLAFRPNISTRNDLDGFTEDDSPPEIGDPVSDIQAAENAAPGVYNYRIKLPYANKAAGTQKTVDGITYNQIVPGIPTDITHVECQYSLNTISAQEKSIKVPWLDCNVYISDVQVGQSYKMRLRYVKRDGRVGAWSAYKYHTVTGATTNYLQLNSVTAYLSGTDLVIVPNMPNKPADFKWFEVRIWKDSAVLSNDFWDYSTTNLMTNSQSNDTKVFRIIRSTDTAGLKTDLKTFGTPGTIISTTGIRYKIACRAWDGKNYSKNSALFTWYGKTISPGIHTIIPAVAALNIQVAPPLFENRVREDLWGMYIWMSKPIINSPTNTTPANSTFTATDTNLVLKSEGLTAIVNDLVVEKTHYFRYAFISALDPTTYTISNSYSFIPKASLVANTTEFPPTPMGMLVSAGINVIFVEIPQTSKIFNNVSVTSGSKALTVSSAAGIQIGQRLRILNIVSGSPALGVPAEIVNIAGTTLTLAYAATGSGTADIIHSQDIKYNYSNYTPGTDLYKFASSTHQSTVVYGIKINNLDQVVTFEQAKDSILGEFGGYEDAPATPKTIFTIPADPGSNYALFFKFKNRAGNLSLNADGPYNIGTGQDAKALINMLSQAITEGTLYNGLQTRIASVDRGDERVAVEVSKLNNQYTVRIDDGGIVSGYGLASSTLGDGTVESEFGVHADRFYITAPAYVGNTAPTTGNYHGRVWVDTSSASAINEAAVTGVSVYYNTYKPTIHNTITFPDDTTYQYWEIKTESGIKALTGQSTAQPTIGTAYSGYTYRGDVWNPEYDYTAKDYIFDQSSGDYYVCKKSYNAVKITDLATKNPSLRGVFTATGATFAVDSTVYIVGEETAIAPHTKKLGSSYTSSGTFYYIIALPASGQFQLALKKRGDAILTNIRGTRKYYDAKLATPAWVTALDKQTMVPFIVQTTPKGTEGKSDYIPAGTYINNAYIANASIGTAQIQDASITSAKIKEINAEKITAGILNADLINTKSLVLDKLDLATMLGNLDGSWTIACPYNSSGPVQRTLTLIPGNYEIILYANFAMEGETSNAAGTYLTSCEVTAEVAGLGARKSVGTSEIKGEGFWRKIITHTDLNLELTSDAITINSQPTVSAVSASGYIGEGGGGWDINVTPTLSSGSYKVTGKDIQVKSGGKAQPVIYQTRMSIVKQTTFTINSGVNVECQFKIAAVKPGPLGGDTWIVHAGSMAVLNYLGNAAVPTYTLTAAGGSVDEGSTLKFTLTTTDVSPGTGFSWEIEHVGSISNNSHYIDLVDDAVQMTNGFINLDNTGKAEFEIKAKADKTTNPTGQQKQFKINVTRPGSGVVASSSTITVNDSSLGPTYSLAFSSGAVDEGVAVTATVSSTNPPVDGTVLTWIVKPSSGFDSDKYFAARSGTVTLVSGGGTFTVTPLEDQETNTGKTFQVELRDSTGTLVLAAGTAVTVNDTSQSLGAASTGTTQSGAGGLDGGYFVGGDDSGRVDGNVYVYFYPDGTWQARTSNGLKTDGNWFSPTTPGIGSLYNISITGSRSPGSTGSATGSPNITNQSLSTFQNCYSIATSYKCVDPMTPIMVDHDGTTILAKDLVAGDKVYTMHEFTKYWDYYTVKEVQTVEQPKKLVTFDDGSTLFVSHSHKFYSDRKWINLSNLRVGDYVASYNQGMKEIISIEDTGIGQVVSIEVEDAHTYIANNIISHNIKFGSALTYFATSIYEFTATITKVGGGDTQTATFILEAYSGLDLR